MFRMTEQSFSPTSHATPRHTDKQRGGQPGESGREGMQQPPRQPPYPQSQPPPMPPAYAYESQFLLGSDSGACCNNGRIEGIDGWTRSSLMSPPPPPTSLIRIARRWCPGLRAVPAAPDPDPGAAAAAAPPHVDGALPPPQRHHLGPHTLAESPAAAHPCAHGRAAARAAGRDLREGPGAAARPPRSVSE